MTNEERDRAIEFIINAQARFSADLAAEADARRAREAETERRAAHSERRLDRLENIARSFVAIGRRTRREVRESLGALTSAQIRSEDERRADRERIDALLIVTERNTVAQANDRESIASLTEVVRQLATARTGNGTNGKQE